ncbi:chalcone and stilbene synthase domain protein [Anaeromyxobacter dehalogenans 2CP-1]|uniref:Chalcone and stilbene synthase domain protein n=1 Tax=Anaeromyxobacter dehalogenans (strain ATCC BAA-258 / DSM 21875 / 2CP-1) TaxID=455488 RepID=B8JAW2_ANAD2|nr:3-oxoacyl-[acyl-carrier-protein] synthase III C-terminal domain-containing protein [Anaeromyxobacter dehalogenans]ACL63773.1 chalcone and stilbene synthase domain protein [Anaeromyxobacter dehalogenans 2CP-1]
MQRAPRPRIRWVSPRRSPVPSTSPNPEVLSVGRALPATVADQETLIAALSAHWGEAHFNTGRLAELHRATGVARRHLALPLEAYPRLGGFGEANAAYARAGAELGEAAVRDALERAGLAPSDVGHLFYVTVTGVATPSLDARLVNRMALPRSVKRTPIFGLGCLAGAAGLARASDALRAFPDEVAVLLSVELCSLTLQRDDASMANVIATGLFGDGAAAVVLGGGARPATARPRGPEVVATASVLYPDTEWVMGWEVVDGGFKVLLSSKVPDVIAANLGADVDRFLGAHGLDRGRIRHWVAHTGGPKVLEAVGGALGLPRAALERSWRSLHDIGNLSSASVLFVLGDLLDSGEARPGDLGLLAAMGPGFAAELVLLRW